MSVPTMPAPLVAAPSRAPLPYGLFSTFTFRHGTDPRWVGAGVKYETVGCGPLQGIGFGGFCADPDPITGLPRTFTRTPGGLDGGMPFAVLASQKCAPVGNTAAAARARAEYLLATNEERAVEHAFWTGSLGNTPNLRGADVLTVAAVPFDVGIGLLEEWIAAEYGAQGIIHCPRLAAAAHPLSLRTSGQTVRTALGTPVAVGAGYDGSGPDGAAATGIARWVYVTPAVTGYRSDVETIDVFDRGSNDQIAYAERSYLLTFEDCGVAAALVTVPGVDPAAVTLPNRTTNPYLIA